MAASRVRQLRRRFIYYLYDFSYHLREIGENIGSKHQKIKIFLKPHIDKILYASTAQQVRDDNFFRLFPVVIQNKENPR